MQTAFRRLLGRADERARQSQWNWIDRDIYLEAYGLVEESDGSRLRTVVAQPDGAPWPVRVRTAGSVHE